MELPIPINIPAVFVSTLAVMCLGFVWYGPLFGKQWMKVMGFTKEHIESVQKRGMGKSYALMALGAFFMSYVFAHAYLFGATYLGSFGVASGMMAGFWNWLGFVAPVTLGSVLWEGKPWTLWFLNAGYYLAVLLSMGVIFGYLV